MKKCELINTNEKYLLKKIIHEIIITISKP